MGEREEARPKEALKTGYPTYLRVVLLYIVCDGIV